MKPKTTYLFLCFLGTVLPYWQFALWALQHGWPLRLVVQDLFANRVSAFFALDVLVSAVVLLHFARVEGSRLKIRGWWVSVVAVCAVGVSLGLPLFLYLRELRLEQEQVAQQ
jgi:hypothetical protein